MVVALYFLASEAAALDIYFVRHAETMANVSGVHSAENNTTFSPRGLEQIKLLTHQLKSYHFDAILVSSVPRALNTVLPYLKESSQRGEIWPELAECCWQQPPQKEIPGELIAAARISLSDAQSPYFIFRDDDSRFDYRNRSYADGIAQVTQAATLLRQRYYGTNKTLLIVAHYHSGQELLSLLLNLPRQQLPPLKNGELLHLQQDELGRITLLQPPLAAH